MRKLALVIIIVILVSAIVQAQSTWTYVSDTDTYLYRGETYALNPQTGKYVTTTESVNYKAYDPVKHQRVTYVDNEPMIIYQFDVNGNVIGTTASTAPGFQAQYQAFQAAPAAAQPVTPEEECVGEICQPPPAAEQPPAAPAPIAAPVMPPVPGSATEPIQNDVDEELLRQMSETQPQGAPAPATVTAPATGPAPIGGNIPQGGVTPAGGAAPAGAPGAQPTTYNYVVGAGGYTDSTGKKWPPGSTLTFNQAVPGLTLSTPEQKAFTETYAGQYTYANGVFSVTKTAPELDDGIAIYKTTTTVTLACTKETGTCAKIEKQETVVCGEGLNVCEKNEKGENIFKPYKSANQEVTTVTGPNSAGQPTTHSKSTAIYDDKGNKVASFKTNYNYENVNPEQRVRAKDITITGTDGKPYYSYTASSKAVVNKIDDMKNSDGTPMSEENKDKLRVAIVNTGDIGFSAAGETLRNAQIFGRIIKGYNDYQGIRQFTNLFWEGHAEDVARKQDEIKRQFCLAAGISNCISSTICEKIYDLEGADNMLAGRGPGGQFVSSAVINAERTPALEVAGMTRQQLIDLFGNTTVIGGRLFNLTDPSFNPKILGKIKVRLYHVQYSIRNNGICEGSVSWGGECDQIDLTYNIHFVRVDQAYNSSYAAPLVDAKWFPGPKLPTIKYLEQAKDDLYKFSATEYSDVCLKFNPKLPSGGGPVAPKTADSLCVPFKESITPTAAVPPNATAPPPAGGAAGVAPGGSI